MIYVLRGGPFDTMAVPFSDGIEPSLSIKTGRYVKPARQSNLRVLIWEPKTMTKNADFLNWVADRFVNVHGESNNTDFVLRLRELAKETGLQPDDKMVEAAARTAHKVCPDKAGLFMFELGREAAKK